MIKAIIKRNRKQKRIAIKTIAAVLMLIITVLFIVSCENDVYTKVVEETFAMDTIITYTLYGKNQTEAVSRINAEVVRLENMLSVTNEQSEISKINSANGVAQNVSDKIIGIITAAQKISEASDGAFDITVYPLVKLWGFTTDKTAVPDKERINDTMLTVNYENIVVDEKNNTVMLPKDYMLDLGGIAKGYTGEVIAQIIKGNEDITGAVVSLGGNVQTVGSKEDGSDWTVAVEHPDGGAFGMLKVGETSVITSGGYQRNFEQDGKVYHHIIDPKTGYPAESDILSAVIVCEDGAKGDALSTASFILGYKKAADLHKSIGGYDFVFLLDDGRVIISENLKQKFSKTDKYDNLEIIVE